MKITNMLNLTYQIVAFYVLWRWFKVHCVDCAYYCRCH